MKEERCIDCYWSTEYMWTGKVSDEYRECHYDPPTVTKNGSDSPMVSNDEFCSKFKKDWK